jgi:MFS family permease
MLATLRHRDFALLWVAGLVSVAGDYALAIALSLHAYALTGSAAATGGVFAAALVPRVLLGSVAGVFVDRWDRKQTMIFADLLRAALLLPLLAVTSADRLWLLYLVRAASGAVGLLFSPAESAYLPKLVGEERLVSANALNALNDNLGRLIGPAVGALLYAGGGLPAVAIADAATYVASAVLIFAIRASGRPEKAGTATNASSEWARVFQDWLAGLALVGKNRSLRAIFAAFGVAFLGEGTFEVGFTPLAVSVLAGGAQGAGTLMSAQAVGGLLAGAGAASTADRFPPWLLLTTGLIALGLCDLSMANASSLVPPGPPAVAVASIFMFLAGFPAVSGMAAGNGMLQAETEDAFRGRVFGALGAVEGVTILIGIALGSVAIDRLGVVPVISFGATMWIVGGLIAFFWLPRETGLVVVGDEGAPA